MLRQTGRIFALLLPMLAMLSFIAPAEAHNTSVTRIDIRIEKNELTVMLNLNQSDMLEHVLKMPHDQGRFNDKAELDDLAPKVLTYIISHMPVTADGQILPEPTATDWPPQHVDLMQPDAHGLARPATIPMTLHYALPSKARHVEVNPKLFTGSGFAALFDVSIYRDATSRPLTTVVDKHQAIQIDMPVGPPAASPPASIANAQENGQTTEAPEPPAGFVSTFFKYMGLGIDHILGFHDDTLFGFHIIIFDGLDHILFVLGLYFLSPKIKQLFLQVTAFTVAHSITLALSAYGIFTLPGYIVEPLIALSITAVAIENLFSREVHWWRWALVFAFGLVHGMGFAEVFHETRLPTGQAATALLSFNLGVECAQISILLGAMLITGWWRTRTWYFRYIAAPASVAIACTGAVWAIQRIMEG